MITTFVLIWLLFLAIFIYVGFKWQASKTPEQRHLEFLIDANDPHVTQVAIEMWGKVPVSFPDSNGKQHALL